jgi:hypothetical protein
MLRPITNWSDLREALRAAGKEIFFCEDCGNVWLGNPKEPPVRCHVRDCRAWANSPKRDAVGRPPAEAE